MILFIEKKVLNISKKTSGFMCSFIIVTILYLIIRHNLLKGIPERENYLYFLKKDSVIIFGTMLKTIPVYFRLMFLPFGLLYHYNGVIPDAVSILDYDVILSFVFVLFLLFLAIYFYRKNSVISFCILFFLITLLPVLNIVPTMSLMAERFLYLPSFALVLLICNLALIGSAKSDFPFLKIGVFIIIIALSYLTIIRNEDWKDNNTLYLSTKGVEGNVLLVNEGNIYANSKQYEEAGALYRRAIEFRDNNLLAHHNLGLIYLLKERLDSAEMKFKKAISIDSLFPDGYFQLATLYNIQGKKQEAIKMLKKLQTISPNYKESNTFLNNLKSGKPVYDNSLSNNFENPNTPGLQINTLQTRSYKYYQEKKYEEAIKDLEQLIELTNDASTKSGYLNNIAMCYAEMENNKLGEKFFLEAVTVDSKNINAMNGLVSIYLKMGNKRKSREYLNQILQINPNEENAKKKLDSINKN